MGFGGVCGMVEQLFICGFCGLYVIGGQKHKRFRLMLSLVQACIHNGHCSLESLCKSN